MKAYSLIWKEPVMYQRYVVLIGTLHMTCAHLHMIGKNINPCGLTYVLLEAAFVGSDTMHVVCSDTTVVQWYVTKLRWRVCEDF